MLWVLGSINADLVMRVERLPAPGETALAPDFAFSPGGKGANQAAAAARAGARVAFAGAIGADDHGRALRAALAEAGVETELSKVVDRATGLAVIGVDDRGENAILVASGANLETRAAQLDGAALDPRATVLCQNEIAPAETEKALVAASASGARAIWNLAPAGAASREALAATDVLIVNQHEAASLLDASATPLDAARALSKRHALSCVLTLGGEGAVAASGEDAFAIEAAPARVVDTTGAGDCFVGILAARLDRGDRLEDALAWANLGAAMACEKLGAQSAQPSAAEIEARLADAPAARRIDALDD